MSHTLLDAQPETGSVADTESDIREDSPANGPPNGIPEKFWDPETEAIRTDALLKSYHELERKLGSTSARDIPDSPEGYEVSPPNDFITIDPNVNTVLHEAGFSKAQAQVVYNLAAERLMPMVTEIASVFEAERQVEKLVEEFGGSERWQQAAHQIKTWGQTNLPQSVFDALATTREGVMAMHDMMNKNEPNISKDANSTKELPSEASLKEMMRNPKYWRDQDPAFVQSVRDGFRMLFPGS